MLKRKLGLAGAFGIAAVATVIWVTHVARAQQQLPPTRVIEFMRPKLNYAQRILEGLTTENYGMIAENARALTKLSDAADWSVLPSLDYSTHSTEFRRLSSELTRAANKRNLDAATLAYVQLTMNCVDCHKHVRTTRHIVK